MNSIIDKIRKLQALAGNAGTEHEAAAAAEAVARLCREHNLEIGVAALEAEETKASERQHNGGRFQPHWTYLAKAVEKLIGVGSYRTINADKSSTMVFFGLSANVQAALLTYRYLLGSVEALYGGWRRTTGETDKRSYCIGAGARIYHTVCAIEESKNTQTDAQSTALVRLENRIIADHLAGLSTRKAPRIHGPKDGSAYYDGYADGASVDVHGANNRMLS